jgi:hypothetical protein
VISPASTHGRRYEYRCWDGCRASGKLSLTGSFWYMVVSFLPTSGGSDCAPQGRPYGVSRVISRLLHISDRSIEYLS